MDQFPPEYVYQDLVALHGHRCPMSTLGLRLAYALLLKKVELPVGIYRYHSNDCAADGIRLVLNQFSSESKFEVVKEQSHRLTCIEGEIVTGDFIVTKAAMDIAWRYRSFCENRVKNESEYNLWESRVALLDTTLARIKSAETSQLFTNIRSEL